jgi:uncharacterized repeat protein (TIGR01451 family)
VTLGDAITHSVTLSVPPGDIAPANNSASFTATIIGSFDPNDKTEAHNGKIEFDDFTTNDWLTYTIRFENTGTSPALNIRITDALDSQLDETSVRLSGSSSICTMQRTGNELTWRFDGINLPPSVSGTEIGHGYVSFEVKPKPGYAIGDMIPNAAAIYFDFNPAIVTNTFETEFVEILGVDTFNVKDIALYPNPVQNHLTIDLKNHANANIQLHDMLGKVILSKSINGQSAELDVSNLSVGMYFVKVNADGNAKTFKILKQ